MPGPNQGGSRRAIRSTQPRADVCTPDTRFRQAARHAVKSPGSPRRGGGHQPCRLQRRIEPSSAAPDCRTPSFARCPQETARERPTGRCALRPARNENFCRAVSIPARRSRDARGNVLESRTRIKDAFGHEQGRGMKILPGKPGRSRPASAGLFSGLLTATDDMAGLAARAASQCRRRRTRGTRQSAGPKGYSTNREIGATLKTRRLDRARKAENRPLMRSQ